MLEPPEPRACPVPAAAFPGLSERDGARGAAPLTAERQEGFAALLALWGPQAVGQVRGDEGPGDGAACALGTLRSAPLPAAGGESGTEPPLRPEPCYRVTASTRTDPVRREQSER